MPTSAGPEAPVLQPVVLNGTSILLSWRGVAGQNYQVQYRSDLTQGDWQLLTSLTATNTTATASGTITADRQRFYRVVALP